jgi:hypothetical protein
VPICPNRLPNNLSFLGTHHFPISRAHSATYGIPIAPSNDIKTNWKPNEFANLRPHD